MGYSHTPTDGARASKHAFLHTRLHWRLEPPAVSARCCLSSTLPLSTRFCARGVLNLDRTRDRRDGRQHTIGTTLPTARGVRARIKYCGRRARTYLRTSHSPLALRLYGLR